MHFIDASESGIEPYFTTHVDRWERARPYLGKGVEVTAQLIRRPQSAMVKRVEAAGISSMIGLFPAMAALYLSGGLSVGGVIAAGITAILGGLYSIPALSMVKSLWNSARKQSKVAEPSWKGTRRYHIEGNKTGRIDSPVLSSSEERTPSPSSLKEFLLDSMKRFPSQKKMVIISGHGLGYHQVAGMRPDEVGDVLRDVAAKTGKPVDIVILESCLMGNLESLLQLKGSASYAVVSEEELWTDTLPLQKVAREGGRGGTPLEMAKSLVSLSGKKDVDTLAAIDMGELPSLASAVDALGAELVKVIQSGGRGKIKKAIGESLKFPTSRKEFLERATLQFMDLGDFLRNLRKYCPQKDLLSKIAMVRWAMNQTVVQETHDKSHSRATGLSVCIGKGGSKILGSLMYGKSSPAPPIGPHWTEFLEAL